MPTASETKTVERKIFPKEFRTIYYCRGGMEGYITPEKAHWSSSMVVLKANDDGTTTMPSEFLASHDQNCQSPVHEIVMDRTVVVT